MTIEERIDNIVENYVELSSDKKLQLRNELLSSLAISFDDLPEEFYDKFVDRQVVDCGGGVLGNIDAQYHYARGFYATIELLKQLFNPEAKQSPSFNWLCVNNVYNERNELLFAKNKQYREQDDRGDADDIAICLCDEFGYKRYFVDNFVRKNFKEI